MGHSVGGIVHRHDVLAGDKYGKAFFVFNGAFQDTIGDQVSHVKLTLKWLFSRTSVIHTIQLEKNNDFVLYALEKFEPDQDIMYKSKHRKKLRRYVDTKLPMNLVELPDIQPAPLEWCDCEERGEAEEVIDSQGCAVHGFCQECERVNAICDCHWFYEEHFCP